MRTAFSLTGLALVTAAIAHAGSSTPVSKVSLVSAGEFRIPAEEGPRSAPHTLQGSIHITSAMRDPELVAATELIRARVGTSFGLRFLVEGEPSEKTVMLHIRVRHPELVRPDTGARSSVDEWPMEANIGIARYTGWRFDAAWEMVPGAWIIQVMDEEREDVLLEHAFDVRLP